MTTSYPEAMHRVNATAFKQHGLSLLDNLDDEGLVITKRGRPVARVIPIGSSNAALIGSLKGKIAAKGGILSTGIRWKAAAGRPKIRRSRLVPLA